ncbi:FMN-binding negative transcriptional regulator [Flaviaesturariibacter flavus]|uniref:FMN-binding negative transcriptional regulator n=1 Tax=Flaviaesturariibacter flavus TaxID=2502780 RepID=A0A4R1BJK7_9BACT|nr:FMN-binding negative transcriptional regulator [Flaviaesturariibacter flavus]TCJ17484.1 FMN-binding negative transcriptional regulator [Flaviaesturariibacter flavus]
MYNLPEFKEQDAALVKQFITEHPFAMVIGVSGEGLPVATQIPVLVEERAGKLFLSGHMMRKTDHELAFSANPNVLCVFSGAHAYVSASWYSNPQQGSTWNYRSVHARGPMRFLDDAGLIEVMRRTSLHFEGGNAASPTAYDNLPKDYTSRLVKAIRGFEVDVESLEHVFKMSQNRDQESYRNIIGKLREGDSEAQAVAKIMEDGEERLFTK